MWEETARLEPGQRTPWPHARLRSGGTADLRDVPGPGAGSHDDVYLDRACGTGTSPSRIPASTSRFGWSFDPSLFRWLISWQPYGGAQALPLAGSYALGVEPWTTQLPLGEAAERGEAQRLGGGESFRTELRARVGKASAWRA